MISLGVVLFSGANPNELWVRALGHLSSALWFAAILLGDIDRLRYPAAQLSMMLPGVMWIGSLSIYALIAAYLFNQHGNKEIGSTLQVLGIAGLFGCMLGAIVSNFAVKSGVIGTDEDRALIKKYSRWSWKLAVLVTLVILSIQGVWTYLELR
ncbi:MAG: hypothetical protein AAFR65_03925 [Pseudomonadota bacterium]